LTRFGLQEKILLVLSYFTPRTFLVIRIGSNGTILTSKWCQLFQTKIWMLC